MQNKYLPAVGKNHHLTESDAVLHSRPVSPRVLGTGDSTTSFRTSSPFLLTSSSTRHHTFTSPAPLSSQPPSISSALHAWQSHSAMELRPESVPPPEPDRYVSSCVASPSSAAPTRSSDSGEAPAPGGEGAAAGMAKKRERCVGSAMAWGSASTVGRRKEMEDAMAVAPEFMADVTCEGFGGCAANERSDDVHVRFFGVYDGHGGPQPDREDELRRIENDGGKVINWQGPRVMGVLAMSRSIGDRYMRPWIIPVPEVSFMARNEDDECLILASDGLWDVMSNGEAAEVACRLLRRRRRGGAVGEVMISPAQAVANHLAKLAYRKNSSDNISVIVVDFRPASSRQTVG